MLELSIWVQSTTKLVESNRQDRTAKHGGGDGKSTPQACAEAVIHTQTYYRWRREYGRLRMDQAKRLKSLEKENGRLKLLVAELSLEKQVLQEVAEGNF